MYSWCTEESGEHVSLPILREVNWGLNQLTGGSGVVSVSYDLVKSRFGDIL